MHFELFSVIAALAGGFVGAAIGGNFGFVFTGFVALIGLAVAAATGSSAILDNIAFGPFVGPHVCFAGGVAAAAYAGRKGYIDSGRDVTSPLARLGKPDVLFVGAAFGLLGYVIKTFVAWLPWFGKNTDAVATTVVISGILARLLLSRQGLIVPERFNTGPGGKWAPTDMWCWVRYQEKPSQLISLGAMFGLFGSFAALTLIKYFANGDATANALAKNAQVFPFAWSAVVILFLCLGMDMPVQHHMTLPGALAAVKFLPVLANGHTPTTANYVVAMLIGAVFGVFGAVLGELMSRLFHQRGDSHIDPPAFAIFPATVLISALATAFA